MKNDNVFPQISRTDMRDAFEQQRSAPLASDIVETVLGGLTKRELFAAMAMQGLMSGSGRTGSYKDYAGDSVKFADALIAELDK